ncbi:unnamed protein product [Lymnaea stagnalis]|uniref:Amine oxidase n=1 Tax=Lymnaea stagnalis TaxID=6523 RepID=A0AAV2H013_LYMST
MEDSIALRLLDSDSESDMEDTYRPEARLRNGKRKIMNNNRLETVGSNKNSLKTVGNNSNNLYTEGNNTNLETVGYNTNLDDLGNNTNLDTSSHLLVRSRTLRGRFLFCALLTSISFNVLFLIIIFIPKDNVDQGDQNSSFSNALQLNSSQLYHDNRVDSLQLEDTTNSFMTMSPLNSDTLTAGPPVQLSSCPATVANCQDDSKQADTTQTYDNVFEDLSSTEIETVYRYLAGKINIKVKNTSDPDANSIYRIELQVPIKGEVIGYLDGRGGKPLREARVIVERPGLPTPVVSEYVVGPLPNPTYYRPNPRRERNSVSYRYHPTYGIHESFAALINEMRNKDLRTIITESYGAFFFDCEEACLMMLPQKTSSAYSDQTLVILSVMYKTDFVTINPVDMMFVMKETDTDSRVFRVDSMFYGGRHYPTISQFIQAYKNNEFPKTKMNPPKPAPQETSFPGTMNLRGRKFPGIPQPGPKQFEPAGRRYRVRSQHIDYMEWSFNVRISTLSGPQVWDVRWAGERIAYEISLQDVGVIYAGANPTTFYQHLSDSAFGLGNQAYGLMSGVDCPEHATFLPQTVYDDITGQPKTVDNAFCVFEHNTGVPLRRHNSNDNINGQNYGGLVDRVLILRTIIVEFNYDYIFDFVFHQNGAVEVVSYATGYIMSQAYHEAEAPFGFRVHGNVVGSIHHHMMNFKIDLDIRGQTNRYETLDFVLDEKKWPWHREGQEVFHQMALQHSLKETERQAVLHYNFSAPKYHIVYNNDEKNQFGNHRAYRLSVSGFSKQILPDESPVLSSRKWTKYQLLTTKRKDQEESSSSIFSMFDGVNPQVDIDSFIQDDDNIVDEDLVLWATVGFHHIPHTEDIPNTPTVGAKATIVLLPFNYFPECPSVGSRDAIRVDANNNKILSQDYGISMESHCVPAMFEFAHLLSNKSKIFP